MQGAQQDLMKFATMSARGRDLKVPSRTDSPSPAAGPTRAPVALLTTVCEQTEVNVRICVYDYVPACISVHTCECMCAHVYTYAHRRISSLSLSLFLYVLLSVYMHVHIYIYIYIYTHTYIYICDLHLSLSLSLSLSIYMWNYLCICTYMHARMHACMQCMQCMYMSMYACMHAFTRVGNEWYELRPRHTPSNSQGFGIRRWAIPRVFLSSVSVWRASTP